MPNRAEYANETNHDAMKIIYFEDTDTLLIEMNNNRINETYDVAPDMIADVDSSGCLVALTVEHAGNHTDTSGCVYQRIASGQTMS